ncbi:MAG: EF-hand domain-containing protein [Bdellovibrio sp.]|nr:EF-hand domain-containing protein [Bdellovibrio sp.]
MKNFRYAVLVLLWGSSVWAVEDSMVTVSKDVPMSVNTVTSGESVVSAPAAGTVSRSGSSTMTVKLVNSCFPTNLRAVSNPLAQSSLVQSKLILKVGEKEYQLYAEYPSKVAGPDGTGAIGKVQNMSTSKYSISAGGTAAVYGNIVEFKTKIPTDYSVDATGTVTMTKGTVSLGASSFRQEVIDCKSGGPVYGQYGWSSQIPTYKCGEFMGKTGDVTASIGGFNVSSDRSIVEIFVSFPGETGFCGGFWSPLMVFFDEQRPRFDNISEFPLNPGGKVAWPEANSPGWFLALDRDDSGKIEKKNELFGDGAKTRNGFEALKELDSNHDGVIDRKDKQFKKLVLWNDKNGDGISQKNEMVRASLKLQKISLKYESTYQGIGQYAEIREKAKFWYKDSKGRMKTGEILDIWLSPRDNATVAQK